MTPSTARPYIPVLVVVALVVAAFAWGAIGGPDPSKGETPVTTLAEVREKGVVHLEEKGIFIVERGRGVIALTDDAQHVGDKVLYCPSSGMFEAEHGEKFDRFGRYFAGPAGADMDRADVFYGERGVFLNGLIVESRGRSRNALDPAGPFCTQ